MGNTNKIKESQKKYYKKNLDKINKSHKEYYKENLHKINESKKEYYVKNLDKIKVSKKDYYKKNKDKVKESQREYFANNKSNIKDYYSKRKDSIKEDQIEYRKKNQDKLSGNKKEYYKNNLDIIKENRKEYYKDNMDTIKEIRKEYYKNNLDKIKEIEKEKNEIKRKIFQQNPDYIPYYSWKSREQSRMNLESLASLLHINTLSDWYRISLNQINQFGGGSIMVKFGTLGNALNYAYPEYPWDLSKFSFTGKRSTQRWLYFKLKELLPNVEIIEDFNHPDLVWEKLNRLVQLDIWVPEHNLALEYQGEHHYYDKHTAYGAGSTSNMFFERDQDKKQMCIEKGVSLVCIPYWWDKRVESLCSTLHQTHPTVFPKVVSPPIPTSPPKSFLQKMTRKQIVDNDILINSVSN